MFIKNKRGLAPVAIVGAALFALLALPFLFGGGFSGAWKLGGFISDVTNVMSQIPTFIWIILGVIFLLKLIGGKRR